MQPECDCPYCLGPHDGCNLNGVLNPNCGEIITVDDWGQWDERVLGPLPTDHHYGYCWRCYKPHYWHSADEPRGWRPITLEEIAVRYAAEHADERRALENDVGSILADHLRYR